MSGYDEPELTNDGVVWSLSPDANDHFFYECTPAQNSIILPWSFKVSYKLNGVPTEAHSPSSLLSTENSRNFQES